jgi:DNA-directed RNA polymerase alpha subunit
LKGGIIEVNSIIQLRIPPVARNILLRNGITSIEKLTTMSEVQLKRIYYLGERSILRIKSELAERGFQLRDHDVINNGGLTTIEEVGFTTHTTGVLLKNKIYCLEVLTMYTEEQLKTFNHLGEAVLIEIKLKLSELDLKLSKIKQF